MELRLDNSERLSRHLIAMSATALTVPGIY
jgi:hypothetical protein